MLIRSSSGSSWPSIGDVFLAFMAVGSQVHPASESASRLTAVLSLRPDETSPWDDSFYFPMGRDGHACCGLHPPRQTCLTRKCKWALSTLSFWTSQSGLSSHLLPLTPWCQFFLGENETVPSWVRLSEDIPLLQASGRFQMARLLRQPFQVV